MEYTVGQKVWFESTARYINSREMSVTRVGRKWVEIGVHKIEKGSNRLIGFDGNTIGTLHVSKEEAEAAKKLESEFSRLKGEVSTLWSTPNGVTLEKIAQVREILGLKE